MFQHLHELEDGTINDFGSTVRQRYYKFFQISNGANMQEGEIRKNRTRFLSFNRTD